ncbi:hypothetical protein ACFYE8_05155 [Rhizobium leguminosarum]|uniref:hypothetical protein n=1 Tax=Rhizobium leguminosarum TaxID=384 RepID=UPI0036D958DE
MSDKNSSDTEQFLGWHRGKKVGVICEDCELLRFYDGSELFEKYDNINMPSLLPKLAKERGCERTENSFYERCRMTYHHKPDVWARKMGYVPRDEIQAEDRTFGDLPEWEGLVAFCRNADCKRKESLDRWALQKRLGKDTKISAIGPRLKCKCGHRGANIVIGYVSR